MLTLETVIKAAKEVVSARGYDFTYGDGYSYCAYVPGTDPRHPGQQRAHPLLLTVQECGCVVGEILKSLGLLTDEIASSTDTISSLIEKGYVDATADASKFLQDIQKMQDQGSPWGVALGEAFMTINRL